MPCQRNHRLTVNNLRRMWPFKIDAALMQPTYYSCSPYTLDERERDQHVVSFARLLAQWFMNKAPTLVDSVKVLNPARSVAAWPVPAPRKEFLFLPRSHLTRFFVGYLHTSTFVVELPSSFRPFHHRSITRVTLDTPTWSTSICGRSTSLVFLFFLLFLFFLSVVR